MTRPNPENLSASVHQRLLNHARETGRPFNEVLRYFGMERFLYRLSKSRLVDTFILKGALLFRAWDTPERRPTIDIDFLAYTDNAPENMVRVIREVCVIQVEPDGVEFDPETVKSVAIKEHADYQGVRSRFRGRLGNARIPMQVDVAFGDVIHPQTHGLEYPTILDFPAPLVRGYPMETVVAEKVEAVVHLGRINSRMKDFYDLWLCARQHDFHGPDLVAAIQKTFANRGTQARSFAEIEQEIHRNENLDSQWQAFCHHLNLLEPVQFESLEPVLQAFLEEPLAAAVAGADFDFHWVAPGPWSKAHG